MDVEAILQGLGKMFTKRDDDGFDEVARLGGLHRGGDADAELCSFGVVEPRGQVDGPLLVGEGLIDGDRAVRVVGGSGALALILALGFDGQEILVELVVSVGVARGESGEAV